MRATGSAACYRLFRLGLCSVSGALLAGCGGGSSSHGGPTPVGIVTPVITIAASPGGTVTPGQTITAAVTVTSMNGVPTGSLVVSSGNYASFPVTVSGAGTATIAVPSNLLATGADTLTATFTSSSPAVYGNALGTTGVTVGAPGPPVAVVSAASQTYSTGGYGSPFRALPLPSGEVLVSVTAATSGFVAFTPATGGTLTLSCFNYVRPAFVADGASAMGFNLTPNGMNVAATLGVDGAIFYNLSTLATCNSTGVQVSQGAVAADEGSFDVVVTPDGKYAFVANEYGVAAGATSEGNIGVVALQYDGTGVITGGTLMGQISTGGQAIAGLTLSPDGSRLYVTSEILGAGMVPAAGSGNAILNKTNCLQQTGGSPQANGLLTVINVAAAEASPGAGAILSVVNAGCSPVRMVETPDNSTLWVAARGDNRVLAFSTGMLEVNAGNALLGYADTGGTAPVGLRLLDAGKVLAVANSNRFGGGTANATLLSIGEPAAASVVGTIATGLFPREITVGSDDRTLYLTNYNSGTFQVIKTVLQ